MNITEAAIDAASLALHCDACTDDEHDACDRSDWAREAEIALRAALPHLQPTIPNTVEPLDRLPVGTIIRGETGSARGTLVAEAAAEGDWEIAGYDEPWLTDGLARFHVAEWTVVWSPA